MISRRLQLLQMVAVVASLASCSSRESNQQGKLTIGIVAYGEEARSVEEYAQFNEFLAKQIHSYIELEPAFNERKALDQIERQVWTMAFAPPGLAAIAIGEYRYIPLFPTQGATIRRAVLVVKEDSSLQALADLANRVVALGQRGSATGYYLPLYDLYGLTVQEIRFSPTPKTVLEWVSTGEVDAGALSKDEFDRYQREVQTPFRVLHTSRPIPGGAVLLGPTVDRNLQEQITKVMNSVPPAMAEAAGYIPNAEVSDYQYLIELIRKVKPIEANVLEKPAQLFVT
jgi:phosphonate transport system substrate-binding protein